MKRGNFTGWLTQVLPEKQMSEAFINSIFLAMSGGFQDAYTYFTRGKVFSNAQTGNVVLMSQHFMMGEWKDGLKYLLPLLEDRETEFVYLDSGRPDHGFILDCLMEMTQLKEHGEYGYELEIIGLFYLIWRHLARQFKAGKTAAPGIEDMDTKVQKDMVFPVHNKWNPGKNLQIQFLMKPFLHPLSQMPLLHC